jgi:CheY-like chemotaxis protein
VTNGAAAISFLRHAAESGTSSLPAVIFLDLKMPVMNGFEVLEWIDTQPWAGQVPVAVLSGSERQDDRDRAKGLGAREYFVKPLLPLELQRVFHEWMDPRAHQPKTGTPA